MTEPTSNPVNRSAWIATGACLLLYAVALAQLSRGVNTGALDGETAAVWLVVFAVPAGLIYLLGLWPLARRPWDGATLLLMVALGLAMRLIVLTAPPTLEDDFYRYLWDGAVTAHGLDPYGHSPTQVLWGSIGAEPVPPELVRLSVEAGPVFERINHPDLKTIYPPVAQLGFAVACWLSPFSTLALRLLMLLADGVTLLLVLHLLARLRLPAAAAALYWWNPVLLREVYGGAHMDVFVLPFVMGAVVLALGRRFAWSMMVLALAGGVKVWPMILAPVLLRPLFAAPARLALAAFVLAATTVIVWSPALPGAFDDGSGFWAYAAGWQNNAGLFPLVESIVRQVLAVAGDGYVHWSQLLARGATGAALLGWIGGQARQPIGDAADAPRRCLLIAAALFLLSPAQFPWYYTWLIPFLAVSPYLPLLAYTALLPHYYVVSLHPAVVWLEHAPVWILVIVAFVSHRCLASVRGPRFQPICAEVVN